MTTIGFIGLGNMGNPMVKNLLKAGHEVIVYDLMPSAIVALVDEGAVAAKSVAELVKQSEVVFTMLQTGEQVSDVCLADDGIFKNAKNNLLYIDSSSIDVTTSRQIHQGAQSKNIAMIDAPVSGGVAGAVAASLTIMVGGESSAYDRAKPMLEVLGKNIIHAGASGNGQAAKICNNMILGISMIAVSEAFTLAKQLGLTEKVLFDIVSKASGQCWSLTSYCPVPGILDNVPANNNYQPGFTVAMMLKDLNLSQEAAESVSVSTPLGAEATSLYGLFSKSGNDSLDFSAIIKMLGEG